MPLAASSFDGQPNGFTFVLGLDDFLFQAVEPDAAVNQLTNELILAYEDAALGVLGCVTGMDADALKLRNTEQDGKLLRFAIRSNISSIIINCQLSIFNYTNVLNVAKWQCGIVALLPSVCCLFSQSSHRASIG